MAIDAHETSRLRRALALAAKGRFEVEPNPVVGCVLEADGRVVGEGWHEAWGGRHAERVALDVAGEAARGSTAYVSLEPCSRQGKTGACTDALLEAGVARVLYAVADPTEAGRGHAALAAGGVAVEGPCLPEEAAPWLDRFREARERDRPWVALKWAMSLDGAIAPRPGVGGPITGPRAAEVTHRLRGHADAVAVGVETALADDPRLTCRLPDGPPAGRPQPLRVLFDSRARLPATSRLVVTASASPVRLYAADPDPARRRRLEEAGVEVVALPGADGRVDVVAALAHLRAGGVARLLVEGGATLHGALLEGGLADQVSVLVAPLLLGGADAVGAVRGTSVRETSEALRLAEVRWRGLGEDLRLDGYVGAAAAPRPLSG